MQYKCSILYVRQISLCSAMHISPYFNFRFYFHVLSFCFFGNDWSVCWEISSWPQCTFIRSWESRANRGHSKTSKQILANTPTHFQPIEVTQKLRNKSWQIHKYTFVQKRSLRYPTTNLGKYTNTFLANKGPYHERGWLYVNTAFHLNLVNE